MRSPEYRTAIEALQFKLATAENEIQDLTDKNERLHGKIEELTESREAFANQFSQLHVVRDTLKMKVEHLKKKLEEQGGEPSTETLAKTQGELAALRSTVNELAERVTRAGCPWKQCGCGTTAIRTSEDEPALYYVECTECGTEGLWKPDKLSAVVAWNER